MSNSNGSAVKSSVVALNTGVNKNKSFQGDGRVLLTTGYDQPSWQAILDRREQRRARRIVDESGALEDGPSFSFAEKLAYKIEKVAEGTNEVKNILQESLGDYLLGVEENSPFCREVGGFLLSNIEDVLARDFSTDYTPDVQKAFQLVLRKEDLGNVELISAYSSHRATICKVEEMISDWLDVRFNPAHLENYDEDRTGTRFDIFAGDIKIETDKESGTVVVGFKVKMNVHVKMDDGTFLEDLNEDKEEPDPAA
jgi:hypothetical protein